MKQRRTDELRRQVHRVYAVDSRPSTASRADVRVSGLEPLTPSLSNRAFGLIKPESNQTLQSRTAVERVCVLP